MTKPRRFVTRELPPVLHRVGWASNPVAFRPWSTILPDTMTGRSDDPHNDYRTFYASASAEAALREKLLQFFRPHPQLLGRLQDLDLNDEEATDVAHLGTVPPSLLTDFVLTTLDVLEPCLVVDVTASGSLDAYYDHSERRVTVGDILDS